MKRVNLFLRIGIIFIILNIFLVTAVYSVDKEIDVTLATQEHSNWCWAASSKMVLDYYGSVQTQCAIANWAWGRNDCCGNADFNWAHACNQSNCMYGDTDKCIQNILTHWGVSSAGQASALSKADVVWEIDVCRPFVIRFAWTGGGGHFLVGYGYEQDGDYVKYMNPLPDEGDTTASYSWTVSTANHTWAHSLKITTDHACASCPSLYFWNGSDFERAASIFPGTVVPEAEYTDYIPLKNLVPVEGMYVFQIRETESEDSFIDKAKLILVDPGSKVDFEEIFMERSPDSHAYSNVGYNSAGTLSDVLTKWFYNWSLSLLVAEHSALGDVRPQLGSSDNWYVPMKTGDILTLKFQALPFMGIKRDFIFIVEGYYIPLVEY